MRRSLLSRLSNLSLLTATFFLLTICGYSIGIFDQNFGNGGKAITDLGSDASVVRIDQQEDGKIVVLGKNNGAFILLRFMTNGNLDTTFGVGGKIVTSYASNLNNVSMTIQSNGFFAVGNNSSVERYRPDGIVSEIVSFPVGAVAGFGPDGKIATAILIPANGSCSSQSLKVSYKLYNSDRSPNASTDFCSGNIGTTGVVGLWGIVPSYSGSFYVGYTHQTLSSSGGRVRELLGSGTVADLQVDIATSGGSLIDLARTRSNGFVSIGYLILSRQLPSYQWTGVQSYLFVNNGAIKKIHGNDKTAALNGNTSLLVLNENFSLQGEANIQQIFGSATEQSSVYVQRDNKILVAGQVTSINGYKNIGLVRYSSVSRGISKVDFDTDSKSDVAVWRPSTGLWYFHNSSDGQIRVFPFGLSEDKPTPADFDGDNKIDIAVWRPSTGFWYWLNSSNNTFSALNFGTAGDVPVPAFYDTDGRADQAVYRPSTGTWWIFGSYRASITAQQFGTAEDISTIGDFDGDGGDDIAVWRPSTGFWYRLNSSGGFDAQQFGISGDIPTAADFDGDGRTDISVFRRSNGFWYGSIVRTIHLTPLILAYRKISRSPEIMTEMVKQMWRSSGRQVGFGICLAHREALLQNNLVLVKMFR